VPFQLSFVDALGAKTPNNNIDRIISLGIADLSFKVFSDSSCASLANGILIKANSPSGQFFVKASADRGSTMSIMDKSLTSLPAISQPIYSYLDSSTPVGTAPSAPTKAEIKFGAASTSSQLSANTCIAMRFVLLDNNSLLAPAGSNGLIANVNFINLNGSATAQVFLSSDCQSASNIVTIPAGKAEALFYIKAPTGVSGSLKGSVSTASAGSTNTSTILAPGVLINFF
jgi:hypothetical protein